MLLKNIIRYSFVNIFYTMIVSTVSLMPKETYICQIEKNSVENLIQFWHKTVENVTYDYDNDDCIFLKETIKNKIYSDLVVLLHYNDDWKTLLTAVHRFSKCQINHVVINFSARNKNFPSIRCCNSTSTLVFTTSKIMTNFEQNFISNDHCFVLNLDQSSTPLLTVSSWCPNTVWISKFIDVNQNQSTYSGMKIIKYDNEECIAKDKRLQKLYLQNRHLIVGVVNNKPPYVINSQMKGVTEYDGVLVKLFQKISRNLQFSYEIKATPDDSFGVVDSNGSWNGLVKQLLSNETDVALSFLTVTSIRSQVIDFSSPYYFETVGIMIQQQEQEINIFRAFSLFTFTVWSAIIASLTVSVLMLYWLHKLHPTPICSPFNSLSECVWFAMCSLATQGTEYTIQTWSSQNFVAFFWLYLTAILAVYSGGLIALLTTSHVPMPFKDLNGLVEYVKLGKFKVCLPAGTAIFEQIMTDPFYEPISNWLKVNPIGIGSPIICERLLTKYKDFAYIDELKNLRMVQMNNCKTSKMIILNDEFFPGYIAIGFRKHSPLNKVISEELTRAVDSGTVEGMIKMYSNISFCDILSPNQLIQANSNKLGLYECSGAFVLFFVGICISLIIFVYEMRRYFYRHCYFVLSVPAND